MAKRGRKTAKRPSRGSERGRQVEPVGLRIVGGKFRGRKLAYGGDLGVRPMKDRTREAIYNLIGPPVRGMLAIDLFAGTGAMALEALSRGAVRAVLIERHLPTARVIRENMATLEVADRCELLTADAFRWAAGPPPSGDEPWLVFCCPPYDFFVNRLDDMLALIGSMLDAAPPRSAVVVESDDRFDHALLPQPEAWDNRRYFPALVSLYWKP